MTTELVKLAARLPAGERNGLDALGPDITANPTGRFTLILTADCIQTMHKIETDETIATLRIRRIEALKGTDAHAGQELLLRAIEQRTGRTTLRLTGDGELEIDEGGDLE